MQCAKGKLVEVHTVWGEKIEGRVFASYNDSDINPFLAIQTSAEPLSYRIFSTNAIANVLEIDEQTPLKLVALPQFVVEEANKREKEAKVRAMVASKKIGKGVSREGQLVFNAVENIYPQTQWSGQSIVVLNDIVIDPPYRMENCRTKTSKSSDSSKSSLLKLVKQIIEKMPKKET